MSQSKGMKGKIDWVHFWPDTRTLYMERGDPGAHASTRFREITEAQAIRLCAVIEGLIARRDGRVFLPYGPRNLDWVWTRRE